MVLFGCELVSSPRHMMSKTAAASQCIKLTRYITSLMKHKWHASAWLLASELTLYDVIKPRSRCSSMLLGGVERTQSLYTVWLKAGCAARLEQHRRLWLHPVNYSQRQMKTEKSSMKGFIMACAVRAKCKGSLYCMLCIFVGLGLYMHTHTSHTLLSVPSMWLFYQIPLGIMTAVTSIDTYTPDPSSYAVHPSSHRKISGGRFPPQSAIMPARRRRCLLCLLCCSLLSSIGPLIETITWKQSAVSMKRSAVI